MYIATYPNFLRHISNAYKNWVFIASFISNCESTFKLSLPVNIKALCAMRHEVVTGCLISARKQSAAKFKFLFLIITNVVAAWFIIIKTEYSHESHYDG